MGSSPAQDLPPADLPSLTLTHPTPAERRHTWAATQPIWGSALTLDAYLAREAYLTTVPLAKAGGITHWILTTTAASSSPAAERPVLASCESLRKRALVCAPGPEGGGGAPVVREGVAHGIASVFTEERFRRRGYAGRMLEELGRRLAGWQDGGRGEGEGGGGEKAGGRVLFSVLYSDIGKKFYAERGWAPFESAHLVFPAGASDGEVDGGEDGEEGVRGAVAKPIGYHEMAELCAVDEELLRDRLRRRVARTKRTCVALVPDLDTMLWHLMREDFVTAHIFKRTPTTKGAIFGEAGKRIWAVWTRAYNTLHVLRLAVEDEECDEEYLAQGLKEIIRMAQKEARGWNATNVQLWNPSEMVKKAMEASGLGCQFEEREQESIASLMWYGDRPASELDWVINEKFGWC